MDFSLYEFRASSFGKIISASGKLTDANKTFLRELFIGELYGIKKDFTNKYFEKGKYCEEDGITMLQNALYPGKLVRKNKKRLHNGWVHGEKDTLVQGKVWDIKNAFDRFTFGKASLTWDYEWQLKCYAWLDNVKEAGLFYCLNNMPEHLIIAEERKLFYQGNFVSYEDKNYLAACDELRLSHNYDSMNLWERFKTWDIILTDEDIDKAKNAVDLSRKYLSQLYTEHQEMVMKNKRLMGLEPTIILAEYDQESKATVISKR